jgi:hypothetical protein
MNVVISDPIVKALHMSETGHSIAQIPCEDEALDIGESEAIFANILLGYNYSHSRLCPITLIDYFG